MRNDQSFLRFVLLKTRRLLNNAEKLTDVSGQAISSSIRTILSTWYGRCKTSWRCCKSRLVELWSIGFLFPWGNCCIIPTSTSVSERQGLTPVDCRLGDKSNTNVWGTQSLPLFTLFQKIHFWTSIEYSCLCSTKGCSRLFCNGTWNDIVNTQFSN